jgi:hypothetical protein
VLRRSMTIASKPSCSEPVSQMPIDQVSDELLLALGLRTLYYLQRLQSLEPEGFKTCTSPQLRRTLLCPSSNYPR